MKRATLFTSFLIAGVCSATALAQDGNGLTVDSTVPLMGEHSGPADPAQITAVDPTAFYSNVTTSGNNGFSAGGTTQVGSSLVTTMVCDDLRLGTSPAVAHITGVRFSVANFDANTVSARPSIAFFQDDRVGGGPGTAAGGVTFSSATLPPSSASVLASGPLANAIDVPVDIANPVVWACQYFDNNGGATGATQAQMNNLGFVFFNPPDLGSSEDVYFGSSGAGSPASNPMGFFDNFGGPPNPIANIGWELLNAGTDTIFRDGFDG